MALGHAQPIAEDSWMLFPECVRFLALTVRLPKVVVTNGDRSQQPLKIKRCGLAQHLTAGVPPKDCGAWKPDLQIFRAALARWGCRPADA